MSWFQGGAGGPGTGRQWHGVDCRHGTRRGGGGSWDDTSGRNSLTEQQTSAPRKVPSPRLAPAPTVSGVRNGWYGCQAGVRDSLRRVPASLTGLPRITATSYLVPLREGGSLPGIVEGDDLGTYVLKFHGAGQGPKALVAEVIVGELYRRLGLRVPELKLMELDPVIGKSEPDEEVQELLVRSGGLNLAVDFLPGALGYDGSTGMPSDEESARILWLDAYVANIDRSWRNTNMLVWHKQLWLIDHGATLYFHHSWTPVERFVGATYDAKDHVFRDADARAVDDEMAASVSSDLLIDVVSLVPDEWVEPGDRSRYVEYMSARLADRSAWLPGGDR